MKNYKVTINVLRDERITMVFTVKSLNEYDASAKAVIKVQDIYAERNPNGSVNLLYFGYHIISVEEDSENEKSDS